MHASARAARTPLSSSMDRPRSAGASSALRRSYPTSAARRTTRRVSAIFPIGASPASSSIESDGERGSRLGRSRRRFDISRRPGAEPSRRIPKTIPVSVRRTPSCAAEPSVCSSRPASSLGVRSPCVVGSSPGPYPPRPEGGRPAFRSVRDALGQGRRGPPPGALRPLGVCARRDSALTPRPSESRTGREGQKSPPRIPRRWPTLRPPRRKA